MVLVIAVLAITRIRHFVPQTGSGCMVRGSSFEVPLTTGQAGLAATIAGVAGRRSMPARAVTIAYAAALQESDLQDLPYGDRDSVGVFQQRPSQGWGTRRQLLDPVYASDRFFAALAAVHGYRHLLIYQAAQAVQRSADGYAYSQYAPQGAIMSGAFTGRTPHAVWCWYGGGDPGTRRLTATSRELTSTFGRLRIRRSGDPAMSVRVGSVAAGWSVASWLVTNASDYGVSYVRFRGYQWTAANGQKGWTRYVAGRHQRPARLTITYG